MPSTTCVPSKTPPVAHMACRRSNGLRARKHGDKTFGQEEEGEGEGTEEGEEGGWDHSRRGDGGEAPHGEDGVEGEGPVFPCKHLRSVRS